MRRDRKDSHRRRFHKRKTCKFCEDNAIVINFKDVKLLKMYLTERGKIIPRRITGNCARHQRRVTTALKQARSIALLPFASGR